jgi:hypothetical protein
MEPVIKPKSLHWSLMGEYETLVFVALPKPMRYWLDLLTEYLHSDKAQK